MRDKLNNLILFDKATYDKLYKEKPTYKLITPAVVSERLKVRLCLCVCVCVCQSGLVCYGVPSVQKGSHNALAKVRYLFNISDI